MSAADRARQIAASARAAERRDWWLITKPGCDPIPVLFVPPRTQVEVMEFCAGHYSHCGVVPLLEQVE